MNIDLTNLNTNLIHELTDYLTKPDSFNIYKDEFTCAYKTFFDLPGENHYHLLANISNQINNSTIIDLGTYRGSSALALSYNKTNKVHTFDIEYDCAGRHHTNIKTNKY
jgi:tRNA1(Val) A37 N6-methylase TrmN6